MTRRIITVLICLFLFFMGALELYGYYLSDILISLVEDPARWDCSYSLSQSSDLDRDARLTGKTIDSRTLEPPVSGNEQCLMIKVGPEEIGSPFKLLLTEPVPVTGVAKTISCWFFNYNILKEIKIIIEDIYGIEYKIPFFYNSGNSGDYLYWRKFTLAIPVFISQRNIIMNFGEGVLFKGFEFKSGVEGVLGVDLITAVTDLYMFDRESY